MDKHFQIYFHVPDTFLTLLNYEWYLHLMNDSDNQVQMILTETETFNVDFNS